MEIELPFWANLLIAAALLFSGTIGTYLVGGVRKGMKWLDEKIDNEYISGVIQRATPVLEELVDETYKTFIKPLKKSGKWNAETAREAKANVAGKFRILWGAEGARKLVHIFGAPDTVDDFIGGLVERAVTTRKTVGRRAKALKVKNPSKG
ncbi:hypothetical protein LCGC14_0424690 [marine sediment metagenome]|uniref:Uncharacterized protein n=1 Tax=marine sediment metagenome TaxID=412755 RepID=A0A0F9T7V3_9ZZZZ